MLKTFVTATAVSALMISGALAQQTQTPAPSAPAATPAPSTTPAPSAGAASTSSPQFIAAQKADQWLASKFTGTDVIGPDNSKIGDVNDVLFDKSGKVVGVIVGVGGFLGIGEKDVAIDMAAFQVVPGNTGSGATTGSTAASDDPNDVKLKVAWTKDQLKAAPSFERYKSARTTSAPANTGTRAPAGGATK